MLKSLALWPQIRARIEAGPLGRHVDAYVGQLVLEGYARGGIRSHVAALDAFGAWLKRRRIPVEAIDENTLDRFGRRFHRRKGTTAHPEGRVREILVGARKFARFLWGRGVAMPASASCATQTELFLRSYQQHLNDTKGLVQHTQRTYLRYARALCNAKFGRSTPDWSALGANDIAEFVREKAALLKPGSSRLPVTAVRTLVRFLEMKGFVPPGLCGAVPTVRQWKHASLPAILSGAELDRVLTDLRDDPLLVLRDRAILLLLARLGLRASEVAALCLDDIDWKRGRLSIRAGKSSRGRSLPLPRDVGVALVAYIRGGRAADRGRGIFLRAHAPLGCLSNAGVSAVAGRALRQAGLPASCRGSHVFRHSVATRMVRSGARFKDVADVLGHACIDTTRIYAKLDIRMLHAVALPWPGGE